MTAATQESSSQAMPQLAASTRLAAGKSEARRLRRTGQIPAVAYGRGLPATSIAVSPKEVLGILKSERGRNTVIQMNIGQGDSGADVKSAALKALLVMIRDYSYHPVRRDLEHVDFVEVKLDQEVDVDVPLHAVGKAEGVTKGGIVRQVYRTVPVRCRPDRIPLKIETDITALNLNEHIATKDLKLDAGVSVRLPAEQTLIAIVTPEKERAEDAAPTGAPGAPAAAGAAAPAGGAAPAAKDAKAAAPAKPDAKKK